MRTAMCLLSLLCTICYALSCHWGIARKIESLSGRIAF
jgi:hypothetical protein